MSYSYKAFDETIAAMSLQNSPYFEEYVFYYHLLSKCKVVFDKNLKAVAGVSFKNNFYVLYINPTEVIIETKNSKILGFTTKMPIEQRLGIIKHEMLHILLGHLIRVEKRNFNLFNVAADCALNQQIKRNHLPDYAIYPDNLPTKEKPKESQTAEYYYEFLEDKNKEENNSFENLIDNIPNLDDHSLWETIDTDEELQKELTKQLIEKVAEDTLKSKGKLPENFEASLLNLTTKKEINWKQLLKQIITNKKVNTKKTLMKKNRRLPNYSWLKGNTKERVFQLAVISDVSASVDDKNLSKLLSEVLNICSIYSTPVHLVQVDTNPYDPQVLTKNTTIFPRKGNGGTFLSPAIEKLKEHNIDFDALIVTTDGYLFEDDIIPFDELKKPLIWLIARNGKIMEQMQKNKMKAIQLNNL